MEDIGREQVSKRESDCMEGEERGQKLRFVLQLTMTIWALMFVGRYLSGTHRGPVNYTKNVCRFVEIPFTHRIIRMHRLTSTRKIETQQTVKALKTTQND